MGILGALFGGGGPSTQEQAIASDENIFAKELMQDYGTLFSEQQGTLQQLRGAYSSIINQGPNQHGFSSDVLNALHTQLLNSNAAGYRNSAQAVRNFLAGQGGGASSGITSGIAAQVEGAIAAEASNKLTSGQTNIMLQDYATGRQNWQTALSGATSLAGLENPTPTGGLAGQELGAAFGSADKIKKEKDAAAAAKWGAITGLATTALTMGAGGFAALGAGESFGEGAKDFLSGMAGGTGAPPPGVSGDFGGET